MDLDFIGWFVAPIAIMLIHERATPIARKFVKLSALLSNPELSAAREEEWLANLEAIEGNTWKLWHAFGILLRFGGASALTKAAGVYRLLDALMTRNRTLAMASGVATGMAVGLSSFSFFWMATGSWNKMMWYGLFMSSVGVVLLVGMRFWRHAKSLRAKELERHDEDKQ